MPELPEVETICKQLKNSLEGQVIKQIIVRQPLLRWPIPEDFATNFSNCKIKHIYRRAKYLIVSCNNKYIQSTLSIIIHLGMSGKLIMTNHDTPIQKHDHVDFILKNNSILRYNDPRRFGTILWTNQDPLKHRLLNTLGLEPFDQLLTSDYLIEKAKRHKSTTIKQFIMNNKIIVGIGNIYANEALFKSQIYPGSIAKNLRIEHVDKILKSIRQILKLAIKQGGTTLKDFFSPEGQIGKFVNTLKVYGRNNQPCIVCDTRIDQLILGQRSTFYCPNCQIKLI